MDVEGEERSGAWAAGEVGLSGWLDRKPLSAPLPASFSRDHNTGTGTARLPETDDPCCQDKWGSLSEEVDHSLRTLWHPWARGRQHSPVPARQQALNQHCKLQDAGPAMHPKSKSLPHCPETQEPLWKVGLRLRATSSWW